MNCKKNLNNKKCIKNGRKRGHTVVTPLHCHFRGAFESVCFLRNSAHERGHQRGHTLQIPRNNKKVGFVCFGFSVCVSSLFALPKSCRRGVKTCSNIARRENKKAAPYRSKSKGPSEWLKSGRELGPFVDRAGSSLPDWKSHRG